MVAAATARVGTAGGAVVVSLTVVSRRLRHVDELFGAEERGGGGKSWKQRCQTGWVEISDDQWQQGCSSSKPEQSINSAASILLQMAPLTQITTKTGLDAHQETQHRKPPKPVNNAFVPMMRIRTHC